MKKTYFFLIFISSLISGCMQTPSDRFRSDLKLLAEELPRRHANLFARIGQEDFNNRIVRIEAGVDTLSEEAFSTALMQLAAAVGDEHTQIIPENLFEFTAPVWFDIFEEGIFITGTTQPEWLYARLLAIGGMSVDKVSERFRTIIPQVNDAYFEKMLQNYLNNTSLLHELGITSSKETAEYTLLTTRNDTASIALKPAPQTALKKIRFAPSSLRESETQYYSYRYIPEQNAVYFNYGKCKNDPQYAFTHFNEALFETIAAERPQRLIIDLRQNSGGNSRLLQPFLNRLKRHELNQKGRLYVLIGKSTFSSALLNALTLKQEFNALLVGEPTAGSVNHFGEVRSFTLPGCGAKVLYSTKYFEKWKGHDGALEPDIRISRSIEDLRNGTDKALAYACRQQHNPSFNPISHD